MEAPDIAKPLEKPLPPAIRKSSFFRGFFFWALSLFLLGMGMKLLMLQRCINPLPYFDQWEGEAMALYVPYYEHALRFSDLFRAQNEHRIFFTHVYDLALLLLNKQWDSQLQMVCNAIMHCATVAGFAWLLALLIDDRRYWPFIWLPMAVAVMSPFGWENALWGFQSQFYFLLMFSLLSIWLLLKKPLSSPWRWGIAAAGCALLSMASGILALLAVSAVLVLDILKNPSGWRLQLPTFGITAVLVFAGLLLKGKAAGGHNYAASLKGFLISLNYNLSWPIGRWPWLALLNLLPLLILAWVYFRSTERELRAERLILGIGCWTILQCLATAYARGGDGKLPAWRYMDTLCFLFAANVWSIMLLAGKYRRSFRLPLAWCALVLVWFVPCLYSLWELNGRAWHDIIPLWAQYQNYRVEHMRAFLATNDEKTLADPDYEKLPWFYVPGLVFLLHTRDIPPILPACARHPLKIVPAGSSPPVFVPGGSKLDLPDPPFEFCLGSYNANGAAARGQFESTPLTSTLPYLEIPVAGDLGKPGLSLELVDLASGKVTEVTPSDPPSGRWLNVDVKAPPGEFKLIAKDESPIGWFAFKEPREMGRLSFWAQKAVGMGKGSLIAGCIALLAAVAFCLLPQSCRGQTHGFGPDSA